MQYKALATLLFATAALTAPASETDASSGDFYDDILLPLETESIPPSILSVIETAVPTTWYEAIETNSAFQSSVIDDLLHSTYPAWYNSLPDSVKSWATSEVEAEVSVLSSYFGTLPTVTPSSGSSSGASSSGASSTPLSTSGTSSSTPLTLTSTATKTTSASGSASTSSSASGSGTSTSTAGAPAATGGIALSLAGAAGVLGLALAL
ncbi:uncharacterized protein N7482_002497 [Penicillium canariense]|uniref:Uncharacterized protein n=1 Tax=Penicillium canariense TaxID=189055 RepID=A0A9W9IIV2_9EURO|nr:uncharacterized protein N7482_002497 [Penicillium canariense]KAJ5176620.1 hypothetical protein N7482_002497 [Penicillium canariense]